MATADEHPSSHPRIGFIGTGAVGTTLARALAVRGARIVALASLRSGRAAELAAVLPGAPTVTTPDGVAERSDLVLLAVPDDTIQTLAAQIRWLPGQGVVHLSGACGAEALAAVTECGAHPAALHPLMTFPALSLDTPVASLLARLDGCTWALEAADEALATTLEQIVQALGGTPIRLSAAARAPYHLAAVLASNYVTALLSAATGVWAGFGVDSATALSALLPLLRATVESLATVGLPHALSGPIARGDTGTIAAHLAWLEAQAAESPTSAALRDAYVALARLTIPLAEAKGTLTPAHAAQIAALLDQHQP